MIGLLVVAFRLEHFPHINMLADYGMGMGMTPPTRLEDAQSAIHNANELSNSFKPWREVQQLKKSISTRSIPQVLTSLILFLFNITLDAYSDSSTTKSLQLTSLLVLVQA